MSDDGNTIFYGHTPCGREVSFSRQQHRERHALKIAQSGKGKSITDANLSLQFIQPYTEDGERREDALFVIDPGGEHAWPLLLEDGCRKVGRQFEYFHLGPNFRYTFDPLSSLRAIEDNPVRRAMIVAAGLDLLFEAGYGKSYWMRLSIADLIDAIERMEAMGEEPGLHALARAMEALRRENHRRKELSEALIALRPLLHYPQLTHQPGKPSIDIGRALEERTVTYFNLNTLFDGAAARAVGTLALWSITAETAYRSAHRLPVVHTHCFIDEAHNLAGGTSFSDAVCMVRKNNLRLQFCFQSSAQAKRAGVWEILRDNCAIKVFMNVSTAPDGDLGELQSHSKDTIRPIRSVTSRGLQGGVTMADHNEPGITRDDAIDVNYGPVGDAFLIFNTGTGHEEPIRLRLAPPTTLEEYRRIITRTDRPGSDEPPQTDPPLPPMPAPTVAEYVANLLNLGEKLRALETWQIVA
jgi:hypothetical protein